MMERDEFGFCRSQLCTGEYILWKGKPERGNLLDSSDIFMIPFSLVWCGFAIFWEYSVISNGISPFALFGIPFVLMGLYIVFGRFIHKAYLRRHTCYVITNQKIIRLRRRKIDMLHANSLPPMRVEVHRNGNGTIRFGETMYGHRRSVGPDMNGGIFTIENIADLRQAQQAIATMTAKH